VTWHGPHFELKMGQMSFANVSCVLAVVTAGGMPGAAVSEAGFGEAAGALAAALGGGAAACAGALGAAAPAPLVAAALETVASLGGALDTVPAGTSGAVLAAGRSGSSASEPSVPPQPATARTRPSKLPQAAREPQAATKK
jgi:hypothetical protein